MRYIVLSMESKGRGDAWMMAIILVNGAGCVKMTKVRLSKLPKTCIRHKEQP